jgi:ProP effector
MSDLAAKMDAPLSELAAAFPAAFSLDPNMVRPVKLGIKKDLYEQSAISHRRIAAALRTYCNSVQYLEASVEGAVRIDLTGEPAGAVTVIEAQHARETLAALAKQARGKGGTKIAGAPSASEAPEGARMEHLSRPPAAPKGTESGKCVATTESAATSAQKRLSLRDLKLAAAARKSNRGS